MLSFGGSKSKNMMFSKDLELTSSYEVRTGTVNIKNKKGDIIWEL